MVEDFRKLEIWQKGHELVLSTYKATHKFPKNEMFSLANQMQRAAVSVTANIAESCGRYGFQDRIQLLIIARGSIFEIRSHLSVSLDLGYLEKEIFDTMDLEYEILSKRLNAYIKHLRESKLNKQ